MMTAIVPEDPRVVMAREYHRTAKTVAKQFRAARDSLIKQLAAEGWTHARLAAAIGCTEGNIRAILKPKGENK